MKKIVNERLLAVRGMVCREYLPLADRLAEDLQPKPDFAGQDVLPLLVLLPLAQKPQKPAVDLACAMQLAFLAGRVHDLNSDRSGKLDGHAILVGDYLYASAAVGLQNAGFDSWLDRIGRALVRRSEARLVRLGWNKRAYVSDGEKLQNLPKEHAEVVSLAAGLAAEAAGWHGEKAAAYAEFGFYLGIIHGMVVYDMCQGEVQSLALAKSKVKLALDKLPELAVADEMLVQPLLAELQPSTVADAKPAEVELWGAWALPNRR